MPFQDIFNENILEILVNYFYKNKDLALIFPDYYLINESGEIFSEIKKVNSKIEIFNSYVKIKDIDKFDLSQKYLIFSGIGNAMSFKEILINNKFNIIEERIFSDHYKYKDEEILRILEFSKKNNLKVLTTEKDYFKISNHLKNEINFIEIDLKIDKEKKLIKFIKSKIDENN